MAEHPGEQTSDEALVPTKPLAPQSPWAVFAVCVVSFYLIMFDLAVVNVAFPDILADFGIDRTAGSWIVSLYNILFGSLLVVAGKSADSIGRRRIFQIGIAAFGLGAALAALASNLTVLLVGRAIQGIGAALMSPAALGLVVAAFPQDRRTQTMAFWGAVGALGVSSGPSIGAAIIQVANWRAAFWIPAVICAVLFVACTRTIRESPISKSAHRPDFLGAALVTAALAVLVFGVSRSRSVGWTSPQTGVAIVIGLVTMAAFLLRQRKHPDPILDLSLFRSRSFTVASFSGLVFFAGYGAYNLNNVLFLRQAWSYSVLEAGLLAVIGPLTVATLSPFTGRVASRMGFRLPAVGGPLIVAAGAVALATSFDETRQPALFMALVVVVGVGIATFGPTNQGASVADLPPARLSVGGAVGPALRQVGAAFGVALLVAAVGTPVTGGELVDAHSNGYLLVAAIMLLAAAINGLQTGRPQPAAAAASSASG
ncbi:MAG: MFS transporter [Acidimicrobiales bacterium]